MKQIILILALLATSHAFANSDCVDYCVSPASHPGVVRVTRLIQTAATPNQAQERWLRQCAIDYGGVPGIIADVTALQDGYDIHIVRARDVQVTDRPNCQ